MRLRACLVHLLPLLRLVWLPLIARQIMVSSHGSGCFLAVARLVARSNSVIDARSIAEHKALVVLYALLVSSSPTFGIE
jgi:hypothetical protein